MRVQLFKSLKNGCTKQSCLLDSKYEIYLDYNKNLNSFFIVSYYRQHSADIKMLSKKDEAIFLTPEAKKNHWF